MREVQKMQEEDKQRYKADIRIRKMRGERVEKEELDWFKQEEPETDQIQTQISQDPEKEIKKQEILRILRRRGMDTQQVAQASQELDTVIWGW